MCIGKCIKGIDSLFIKLFFSRFKIESDKKFQNIYESSAEGWLQFAVWLSVADFVTVYIIFFYLYINRIVSNNFYCNTVSRKAKEGGSGGGKIGTLTRKEPFSCALKTRLFPSSLGFFNILFCSVFVTLIILTGYFCLCVCLWVWVCVFLFVFGKIDYDIKKQQFLGEENMFLINTSTVYNNICFYYTQFSSEYKSSQTLHWFCDFFSSSS